MRPIYLIRSDCQKAAEALWGKEDAPKFWEKDKKGNDQKRIDLDLPRSFFVTPYGSFSTMQQMWSDCADDEDYHFLQGDMGGSCIPAFYYDKYAVDVLQHQEAFQGQTDATDTPETKALATSKSLRFAYINDSGEMCGISLTYNKLTPSQWIFAIQSNANKPAGQRRMAIFIHEIPFADQANALWSTIEAMLISLNSVTVAELLKTLIIPKNHSVNTLLVKTIRENVQTRKCIRPKELLDIYRAKLHKDSNTTAPTFS